MKIDRYDVTVVGLTGTTKEGKVIDLVHFSCPADMMDVQFEHIIKRGLDVTLPRGFEVKAKVKAEAKKAK